MQTNNPDVHGGRSGMVPHTSWGGDAARINRGKYRRAWQQECWFEPSRPARKEDVMTQQELADRVGTKKSYISRIEHGSVEPSAGLFLSIINALGLSIARPVI